MKNLKKITAVILSFVLIFSFTSIPAGAVSENGDSEWSDLTESEYPFIFVHGMGGWGQYEEFTNSVPYWGGMTIDGLSMSMNKDINLIELLNENGVEAYAASVGPFSSAWDRACELYAQLTGTTVDYGVAHSAAHNHDRYGYDYTGNALMGEAWDMQTALNILGHSFGGPTVRLFASLMAYGDEDEKAAAYASGEELSPLFEGGHGELIHSVTTLSSPNDGTPIADFLVEVKLIALIAFVGNVLGCLFGDNIMMWSMRLGHFGITAKQDEDKATFSLPAIRNFYYANDNCGYDMTIKGAKELNEKIQVNPYAYYYSYCAISTEENCLGYQALPSLSMFTFSSTVLSLYEGKIIEGTEMTKEWAVSDGIVPLASAKVPMKDASAAKDYEDTLAAGEELTTGVWYMMEPLNGLMHTGFMGQAGWPTSFEDFYVDYVNMVNAN